MPRRDDGTDVVLRALRRTRQVRRFTEEPVDEDDLRAILEVARWTGSSENGQLWQFIVIRDGAVRRRIGELSRYARYVGRHRWPSPSRCPVRISRPTRTTRAARPNASWSPPERWTSGPASAWTETPERAEVGALLGVTPPAFVRTIVAIGHPTEDARQARTGPGTGRRPLAEIVRER